MNEPLNPRATSVTVEGVEDGFVIEEGYRGEIDSRGSTRLVIAVPTARLAEVHTGLIRVLSEPLGLLYRQEVDRRSPRPEGAPPKDSIALELTHDRLLGAFRDAAHLVWHDARAEIWVRGRHGDQVVLDRDGLLYTYPDDPAFRDALAALGVPIKKVPTIAERDYVKHWFRSDADALEDQLLATLGAAQVPHRR